MMNLPRPTAVLIALSLATACRSTAPEFEPSEADDRLVYRVVAEDLARQNAGPILLAPETLEWGSSLRPYLDQRTWAQAWPRGAQLTGSFRRRNASTELVPLDESESVRLADEQDRIRIPGDAVHRPPQALGAQALDDRVLPVRGRPGALRRERLCHGYGVTQ